MKLSPELELLFKAININHRVGIVENKAQEFCVSELIEQSETHNFDDEFVKRVFSNENDIMRLIIDNPTKKIHKQIWIILSNDPELKARVIKEAEYELDEDELNYFMCFMK